MTDQSMPEEGMTEATDRTALLQKMLVGAAFAVPAVSSFAMSNAGAGVVANWVPQYGAYGDGSVGVLPLGYLQPSGTIMQVTPGVLPPGTDTVHLHFEVTAGSVNCAVQVPPGGDTIVFVPGEAGTYDDAAIPLPGGPLGAATPAGIYFSHHSGNPATIDNVLLEAMT